MADDMESLNGVTAESMANELASIRNRLNFDQAVDGLVQTPLLVLSANDGLAPSTDMLINAIKAKGGNNITASMLRRITAGQTIASSWRAPSSHGSPACIETCAPKPWPQAYWDFTSTKRPFPLARAFPAPSRIFASAQCLRPSLRTKIPSSRIGAPEGTGRR